MKQPERVFLVGPMGAGKSTIGKYLSSELSYTFLDSDREIEERTGADIPWIFDVEGESGFRVRESSVIDELTQLDHIVLATGGGAILADENRRNLSERGVVVYLKTSLEQQVARTHRDRKRPLLQNENPEEVLMKLMEVRAPLYESIADITVSTDSNSPGSVALRICEQLKELRES